MTIQGEFNSEEFGQSLAQQAAEVIPPEVAEHKKFVVDTLYRFCVLAGDALKNDPQVEVTSEQAVMISQFIGEWTFHKSVDVIKAGIPQALWDQILQKIAFVVFEASKNTQLNNFEQGEAVQFVESEVNNAYKQLIEDLVQEGHIDRGVDEVLSHSNIDDVANQANVSMTKEEEEKELKMASMALFMKYLPQEDIEKMTRALSDEDRQKIIAYMSMQDLEQRVDPGIVNSYLNSFNEFLPGVKEKIIKKQSLSNIMEILNNLPPKLTDRVFKNERSYIKNFIKVCRSDKIDLKVLNKFSPELSDVISDYLLQKTGG